MSLAELIAVLSNPRAFTHEVDDMKIHQSHISVVFLAGPNAYKLKRRLDLGFLDDRRLEKRLRCSRQQDLMDRRLAPSVYLDVILFPAVRFGRQLGMVKAS